MKPKPAPTSPDRPGPLLVCLAAWAIPGTGHLWLGRVRKGAILLVSLLSMYGVGLQLDGEIFTLDPAQPLVLMAGLADLGIGLLGLVARGLEWGQGVPEAPTYEYGNTFLVVAGLLNLLVVLDAYDTVVGRK